jgi:hypothetical protein
MQRCYGADEAQPEQSAHRIDNKLLGRQVHHAQQSLQERAPLLLEDLHSVVSKANSQSHEPGLSAALRATEAQGARLAASGGQ